MSQKEDDGDEGDYTVIYVGDSATDLEALLAADVGVCVRDEIMGASQLELADALTRIGVLVVSIDEGIGMKQINNERAKVVYWAEGLEQIAKALTKD
jgi:phosphoglycolate phosphatase-like HAD superfamily hydrolase